MRRRMYKESNRREVLSHHFAYTSTNIYLIIISCLIHIFFIGREPFKDRHLFFYFIFLVFIYLFIWLHQVLVEAGGLLSCSSQAP